MADQNVEPTPAEWVARFLVLPPAEQLEWAEQAIEGSATATVCRVEAHRARIREFDRRADGNAIARSILGHRSFCADCLPHVQQALAALGGATNEQLAGGSQ